MKIAVDAATDASARHARSYLVAGNICNTYEFEDYRDVDRYRRDVLPGIRRQVTWACDAGVDFVVGETYYCLDEARLHLEVIKRAGLPAVITLSARGDATPEGVSYEEACRILWEEGADVVGLNCTRGPATMLPILERIKKTIPPHGHVAALPVPYRTDEKEPIFLRLGRGQAFPTGLDAHLCPDHPARSRTLHDAVLGVMQGDCDDIVTVEGLLVRQEKGFGLFNSHEQRNVSWIVA